MSAPPTHQARTGNKLEIINQLCVSKDDELDLHGLGLDEYPSEIDGLAQQGMLPPLRLLRLDGNKIGGFSPQACQLLSRLVVLRLENNAIKELPEAIGNFQNLTNLTVGFNELVFLPPTVGRLTNLQHLSLPGNYVNVLPPELAHLTNLVHFDCSGNRIQELPENFLARLSSLQYLNLSRNKLTKLDDQMFSHSSALEVLKLSNNSLTQLPSLKQCVRLKTLEVLRNPKLASLTSSTIELPMISRLAFDHSLKIPRHVCDEGAESILRFLTSASKLQLSFEAHGHWVSDSERNKCVACNASFTTFNRKHHCRLCGEIFCKKCSNKSHIVPSFEVVSHSASAIRLCEDCFTFVSTGKLSERHQQSASRRSIAMPSSSSSSVDSMPPTSPQASVSASATDEVTEDVPEEHEVFGLTGDKSQWSKAELDAQLQSVKQRLHRLHKDRKAVERVKKALSSDPTAVAKVEKELEVLLRRIEAMKQGKETIRTQLNELGGGNDGDGGVAGDSSGEVDDESDRASEVHTTAEGLPALRARVIYDYIADESHETEMSVREGDVVLVLDQSTPEWWYVESAESGVKGYVPESFMELE